MDKEARREITEFAELLYNFREAMDIKSIKASIESFLLANHYRKLPKDKPPLLDKPRIKQIVENDWVKYVEPFLDGLNSIQAEEKLKELPDVFEWIAQAQREADIKYYEQ